MELKAHVWFPTLIWQMSLPESEKPALSEIKDFCTTKYGVKFEIYEKVHAKGKTTEPFTTLNQLNPAGDVEWNFEKFLINRHGDAIARFKSSIEPDSPQITQAIEKLLD